MYKICPKCGYERKNSDIGSGNTCPACGLVFSKWLQQRYVKENNEQGCKIRHGKYTSRQIFNKDIMKRLWSSVTYIDPLAGKTRFYTYCIIYTLLFFWGWMLIAADHYNAELNQSFLHGINLIFHEAGHVIFSVFNRFVAILGGSLLQLLIPLLVIAVMLVKNQDAFAASVGLWWLAQSMMDLVSYVDDAQRQEMMLLGGVRGKDMPGIHDWNNILGALGLLEHSHVIAVMLSWLAITLMLLAFYWGAYILWKTYRVLHHNSSL